MQDAAPRSVYLDGHATTPLSDEVQDAMAPWWSAMAANSHSPHAFGQRAARAVDAARQQVGELLDVSPSEIFFTSGATESNNVALLGVADACCDELGRKGNIVVSSIEHKSVLGPAEHLRKRGWEIRLAPVTNDGVVRLDVLAELIDEDTLLTSIMAANNEIGTIQPLDKITEICRSRGSLLHVDAAQAAGKIPLSLADVDYASISSHKMYGPMGIGALFVSSAAPLRPRPLFFGGDQERGLRPGTLPVPLAVGFGAAAGLCAEELRREGRRAAELRVFLLEELRRKNVVFTVNASGAARLPGSVSLMMQQATAIDIILRLADEVLIAEGSACSSGNISPSHVLSAIGLSADEAARCIRLMISRYTTEADLLIAADRIQVATGVIRQ